MPRWWWICARQWWIFTHPRWWGHGSAPPERGRSFEPAQRRHATRSPTEQQRKEDLRTRFLRIKSEQAELARKEPVKGRTEERKSRHGKRATNAAEDYVDTVQRPRHQEAARKSGTDKGRRERQEKPAVVGKTDAHKRKRLPREATPRPEPAVAGKGRHTEVRQPRQLPRAAAEDQRGTRRRTLPGVTDVSLSSETLSDMSPTETMDSSSEATEVPTERPCRGYFDDLGVADCSQKDLDDQFMADHGRAKTAVERQNPIAGPRNRSPAVAGQHERRQGRARSRSSSSARSRSRSRSRSAAHYQSRQPAMPVHLYPHTDAPCGFPRPRWAEQQPPNQWIGSSEAVRSWGPPPPPPPLPPPTAPPPRAHLVPKTEFETGGGGDIGSMMVVYIAVGAEANLLDVAVDVRKHGPTIAMIVCASHLDAETLKTHLENARTQPSEEEDTRGGGDKGENQYTCAHTDSHVIAGRLGVVASVELRYQEALNAVDSVAVAEVTLNVQVCGQLLFRVASLEVDSLGSGGEDNSAVVETSRSFEKLRQLFNRYLVRIVAGEFGAKVGHFLRIMRETMATEVVAVSRYRVTGDDLVDCITGSFIFVMGPFMKKTILEDIKEKGPKDHGPGLFVVSDLGLPPGALESSSEPTRGGGAWTRGWSCLRQVKQKATSPSLV